MHRMRSLFVITLLVSVTAFAQEQSSAERFHNDHDGRFAGARHYILEPQHVLSDAERAELATDGIFVGRPMPNGRYLARVSANAALDGHDLTIRSMEAITAERKIAPSVARAAVSGRTYTRVNIVFNDEVSVDEARSAVLAAGGQLDQPFATRFERPRNLRARIPSTAVTQLASDERVFTIHGRAARIMSDNKDEAITARVDLIQAAPYNLTGSGVVLSFFEISPPDTTHPEFGGRLTSHFAPGSSSGDSEHSTHVAGTIGAQGINPDAKGMSPAATMHGFGVDEEGVWIDQKATDIQTLGSIADNNSWGYILGWCNERCASSTGWLWTGNDEYIGGYDSTDSALDEIARDGKVLMVHSAGNEGGTLGPTTAPFLHDHADPESGDPIPNEKFCYSADGSGTDCAAPCSAGPTHCEIVRHPVHAAVGSIGLTASSKNVVAVGATDSGRNVVNFSSKGPTRDGRVKPDITAKGFGTFSTVPNNGYGRLSGTSMASPVVTGTIGLLTQLWKQTFNGATPTQAPLKGLLIAGAFDIGNPGPDFINGFGALDAKASADIIVADGGTGKRIVSSSVAQGGQFDIPLTLPAGDVRVVLVWTDPEVVLLGDDLAASALVNDLDVVVKDANGAQTLPYILSASSPTANATRGVNTVDNVEEVEIKSAAAGNYHVIVSGKRVTVDSPQGFSLVSTAGTFGAAPVPCTDATEPNETQAQAFGLGSGQTVSARLCSASDVDIFKMHVDKAGTLTFTVNSTDSPVRAVLSGNGASATRDVASASSGTITQSVTPGDYFVQVTANGALATGSYTVNATYPTISTGRGRAARH